MTKDETQILYLLVNLFLFTNLNGQKLPVFKTMAQHARATSLFLHFFFLRMELNHQRIKLEQNPTPLFVQTTIIIYIEMKFNSIESLPTTVTSTVFESLPSSFSASRVYW